jgi:hypothetical protein
VGIEQGGKHQPLHPGPLAGGEQVLLAGPVEVIGTAGIGGPGSGGIDYRLLVFQGVIEAFGFKQIATGEFTAPLLLERSLAGRAHHAAHLMSGVECTSSDLATQGARATYHQNLHGKSSSGLEPRGASE